MVLAAGFKFELVHADSKIPFQEHPHAGKIYVEVEPGAEYFVSIQKVDKTETDVYLGFSVDGGNPLSYIQYPKKSLDKDPWYRGLMRVENGISSQTALEFVKPKLSDSSNSSERLMMGKVEFKINELTFTGRMVPRYNASSNFEAATVDVNGTGASKKKNLRSAEGSNSYNSSISTMIEEIQIGALLDTSKFRRTHSPANGFTCFHPSVAQLTLSSPQFFFILFLCCPFLLVPALTVTLNYCAALGLMEVGAIPKPDFWTHHRMKHPLKPGSNPHAVKDAVVGADGKTFDLSKVDSDDED